MDASAVKPLSLLGAGFVLVATAVSADWSSPRLLAEFTEQAASVVLYLGGAFGSLAAGAASGMAVARRSRSEMLGWVVGAAVFLAAGLAMTAAVTQIPGVGWRIERAMTDE